jgi:hypothetical protein
VHFDPHTGFEAEAFAAIESTLPKGANIDAVFLQLESAARAYVTARRDMKQQRKRLERRLKLIEELGTDLRPERRHPTVLDDGGAPRRALEALGVIRGQTIAALTVYDEQVRARARRADPTREELYGEILRVWVEAGGQLRLSTSKTGGPLARYFTGVMTAITGNAPSFEGLRDIVDRWKSLQSWSGCSERQKKRSEPN